MALSYSAKQDQTSLRRGIAALGELLSIHCGCRNPRFSARACSGSNQNLGIHPGAWFGPEPEAHPDHRVATPSEYVVHNHSILDIIGNTRHLPSGTTAKARVSLPSESSRTQGLDSIRVGPTRSQACGTRPSVNERRQVLREPRSLSRILSLQRCSPFPSDSNDLFGGT